MKLEIFLTALLACSVITSLIVEAIKKMTGNKDKAWNICAAVVSVIVAGTVSAAYMVMTELKPDAKTWVVVAALVLGSWLCAMLGYDKIKQAIMQIKGGGQGE